MSDGGGPVVSCFHHPIDKDPSLSDLADLPLGWAAERAKLGEPWTRYKREVEEEPSQGRAVRRAHISNPLRARAEQPG